MNDTVRLSQTPPDRTSMNYAALRESGMELIRQLAKDTWTDHNVHDPGITLLEAFSYAMTELGLRLQLDVADLLRSGEGHAPPALVPVHRALPSAPVTTDDLRKVLLDHYLVSSAWIASDVNGEFQGLYEVMLAFKDLDLNSNTYPLIVEFDGNSYTLDIALPHLDEKEATPFRAGATINQVELNPEGGLWRTLTEPQSYFGTLRVHYTDSDGAASIDL